MFDGVYQVWVVTGPDEWANLLSSHSTAREAIECAKRRLAVATATPTRCEVWANITDPGPIFSVGTPTKYGNRTTCVRNDIKRFLAGLDLGETITAAYGAEYVAEAEGILREFLGGSK